MDPLNRRSLEILRHVVDAYIQTGEPIGSLTLAQRLGMNVSSATIRNVLSKLEDRGLLYAPHTSAGRLPTEAGLRFFVQGILESDIMSEEDRFIIESKCSQKNLSLPEVLNQAASILSGLSSCASFLIVPKTEPILKHIEFIALEPNKALAVLVTDDGDVENRLIDIPAGIPLSNLTEASNYLNHKLAGQTLSQAKKQILEELRSHEAQLDKLSKSIVQKGLAIWAGKGKDASLVIQGQSKLLQNIAQIEELSIIKNIFDLLERKETLLNLLDASLHGDGVQIFIGAENEWFSHVGCSIVLSSCESSTGKIAGAIGVIGPTRINYGRIIPMVNYTAKIVSHLLK